MLNSIQSFDKHTGLHKAASTYVQNRQKPFVTSSRPIYSRVQTTAVPTTTTTTTQRSKFNSFNRFASSPSGFVGGSDLKTSSSQDSRRSQNENVFESDEKPKATIKPLSIEFEPPFLHPVFNLHDATTTTKTTTTTTTPKSLQFTRPTILIPTATIPSFSQSTVNSISNFGSNEEQDQNRPSSGVSNFGDRLKTSTLTPVTSLPTLIPVIGEDSKIKEPPTVLLPPYETPIGVPTQGPPVYREWKLPSSELEPPFDENKSNGAITLSSDENQIPVIPPHTTQSIDPPFLDKDLVPPLFESFNNIKLPSLSLRPPAYSSIPVYNDTAPSATNHSFPSFNALNTPSIKSNDKLQTQRSVTTMPTVSNTISAKRNSETTTRKELNYFDLKKQFSIPEFTFPLENIERPSYTENNAVNSFQIKIPDEISQSQEVISDGSSNEVQRKPWYGENARCPECHPSFLKPGTCEPCIKIR